MLRSMITFCLIFSFIISTSLSARPLLRAKSISASSQKSKIKLKNWKAFSQLNSGDRYKYIYELFVLVHLIESFESHRGKKFADTNFRNEKNLQKIFSFLNEEAKAEEAKPDGGETFLADDFNIGPGAIIEASAKFKADINTWCKVSNDVLPTCIANKIMEADAIESCKDSKDNKTLNVCVRNKMQEQKKASAPVVEKNPRVESNPNLKTESNVTITSNPDGSQIQISTDGANKAAATDVKKENVIAQNTLADQAANGANANTVESTQSKDQQNTVTQAATQDSATQMVKKDDPCFYGAWVSQYSVYRWPVANNIKCKRPAGSETCMRDNQTDKDLFKCFNFGLQNFENELCIPWQPSKDITERCVVVIKKLLNRSKLKVSKNDYEEMIKKISDYFVKDLSRINYICQNNKSGYANECLSMLTFKDFVEKQVSENPLNQAQIQNQEQVSSSNPTKLNVVEPADANNNGVVKKGDLNTEPIPKQNTQETAK